MKTEIFESYAKLSEEAARIIISRIKKKPNFVLGLATGSTPINLYKELIRAHQKGEADLSQLTTFNLDEYCGLPDNHKQSYHTFMNDNLFQHINIDQTKTFFPSCNTANPAEYDNQIREAGGIDLQVLGIGRNGHIAFNEPGSSFQSQTRVVDLTPTTIKDNARFFANEEDVPIKAVTMGLATIMKATEILLLASGKSKKEAVKKMTTEPPNENLPASILQDHPNVTVLLDKEAVGE